MLPNTPNSLAIPVPNFIARVSVPVARPTASIGFEIALDKGMKGVDVWVDYCDTLYTAGEENNLSKVVNRALDNQPHKSEIYYRFAAYLTKSGQLDEAENILFLALSMDKSKINYLFDFMPEAEDYDFVNNMLEEFENK